MDPAPKPLKRGNQTMNMSLKRSLLGAGFAAISLLILSTAAWSKGPGGGMDHDPVRMMAHMSDRLDLTEEQQAQVGELLSASSQDSAADRKRLRELREELRESQGDFNPEQAQAMADEIGQITSRMVFETASTQAQVYKLLTPEQRQKMESMMAARAERRGKWRRDGSSKEE
jgi:Spy/CpxP family protein refolding chaperone